MKYPLKKTFTVFLQLKTGWRKRMIKLVIPQATILDIAEFSQSSDSRKIDFIISKFSQWGAGKYAGKLYMKLGVRVGEILTDTFFYKRAQQEIPKTVKDLATKKGVYTYDTPDSVIFGIIASEYSITPHKLLEYTMDELYFLFEAMQYKNFNEEQKKELQRLKRVQEIEENRDVLDEKVKKLEDYFNKT